MLTPADAERIVLSQIRSLPMEECPLSEAHGRVLREPVAADRDFPPFDRATMDGFALRASAVHAGLRNFRIMGLQAAGTAPLTVNSAEECLEIATGAMRPIGTDVVVPYEQTQRNGEVVELLPGDTLTAGQNFHAQGSDAAAGTCLAHAGTQLGGREIAVAASCGRISLKVTARPRVAVAATGDELVDISMQDPAPHQIRRSNDLALRAALLTAGVASVECVHLRDRPDEIEASLRRLLEEFDLLVLTGGVSKGRLDYIPGILTKLGVENRIHGVAQRPGKPFWFGMSPRLTPVFALPGNPVSSYVCLHRYVLPALAKMLGLEFPVRHQVALTDAGIQSPASLTRFIPVCISKDDRDGLPIAHPRMTNTSGDFASLVGTDGFVEIPASRAGRDAVSLAAFWPWA